MSYKSQYEGLGDKPFLTSSMIVDFVECGVLFRKTYIEDLPTQSSSAAVFGIAGHYAEGEINFAQKILSKKDEPVSVVQDAFNDKYKSFWGNIRWSKQERKEGVRTIYRKAKEEGIRVMKQAHTVLAPEIKPISVERIVRIPLKDFKYDLFGKMDIETLRTIVDLKFPKATKRQRDADHNVGLTLYSLAKTVQDGRTPESVSLAGVARLKTPKPFVIKSHRTQEDFDRVLLTVAKIHKCIESGVFLPSSPLGWKCSEAYCDFYNNCKERLWR